MTHGNECPKCWGDGYIDHDLGREACPCTRPEPAEEQPR